MIPSAALGVGDLYLLFFACGVGSAPYGLTTFQESLDSILTYLALSIWVRFMSSPIKLLRHRRWPRVIRQPRGQPHRVVRRSQQVARV